MTRKWVTESEALVASLRQKDRTFHGLAHEFRYLQAELLGEYRKSMDVRHPRDVGTVREDILRNFLNDGGFIPPRYGVSRASTRVASTTGHVSKELDIVIYDAAESISLMRRQGSYQVLPIESTYGSIQVKSKLNRKELKDAFENIASFKGLKAEHPRKTQFGSTKGPLSSRGFGLIFAYDSDLDWSELVEEIKLLQAASERELLCNGIFILSKGHFVFGTSSYYALQNEQMLGADDLILHGFPDRSNDALYSFYAALMELLVGTQTSSPPYGNYFNVPLVADKYSYQFTFGHFTELMKCTKHGPFVKKISPDNLEKLVLLGQITEKRSWKSIRDELYDFGSPVNPQRGDDIPCYFVYNPTNAPLSGILLQEIEGASDGEAKFVIKANSYVQVSLLSADLQVLIPNCYIAEIFEPCPKCKTWPTFAINNTSHPETIRGGEG